MYRLVDVPKDGNCFYTAFAVAAGLTMSPRGLRRMVDRHLTDEERMIAGVVSDEPIETRWADDYDIRALVRAHPGVCLLVFDPDEESVYAMGNHALNTRTVAVQRRAYHYQALFVDVPAANRLRRQLHRTMRAPHPVLYAPPASMSTSPLVACVCIGLLVAVVCSISVGLRHAPG